jgi:hypothetical protein
VGSLKDEAVTEIVGAKRPRLNWSPEERAEWLWLFEQSGKSAAEFCRDNDLSPATLSLWRSQMPEPIDEPCGALVEVTAALTAVSSAPNSSSAPPASHHERAVVQLPSGWRIEVPVGADARWLNEVLQTLVLLKV